MNVVSIKYSVKELFGTGPDDPGRVQESGEVEVVAGGKRIAVILSPKEYQRLQEASS